MWIEGQPLAPMIDTAAPMPLFSPDGAHVAYAALKDDGWRLVAQRGSHRQYPHPSKPGQVTVAGKPGLNVPRGTAANILRQAGLRRSK